MTEGRRPRRVAETLRKHLAEAFSRELFDPRLSGLIVTRVDSRAFSGRLGRRR
jgi:ribosome-binding factor A